MAELYPVLEVHDLDRAVAGPGTQDGGAVPEEDAEAALLAGAGSPALVPVGQFLRGPEVVLDDRRLR